MKHLIVILFMCICSKSNGQIITTIAGTGVGGYAGDELPAISAELNNPDNIKFDHSGNLYIADEHNHVVRKINTSGVITTIAGTGTRGYSGDGGPATNAELDRPGDLAFDETGNLYISEYGNEIIRKINTFGIISTVAGTGWAGYNGDGIAATAAQLSDPIGLVFDNDGNLIFSDNANRRVRKINSSGIISTIVGTGTAGYMGDGGPATAAEILSSGYNAISPANELYVTDYYNYVIRKVNSSGIITTVVGTGIAGYTGDGGPASTATLSFPSAVIFDQTGNMYISDRVVIRKVNTSGIITTIAGNGTIGYGGDGGPATAAEFNTDVLCGAIDEAGNLYIADPLNNRVRRITYNATAITKIINIPLTISVYPNPAHSEVNIEANEKLETVELVNILGQSIWSNNFSAEKVKINIENLPAGLYFVKANGGYAGKFVKE